MSTKEKSYQLPFIKGISAGFPSPARDYMEDSINLNHALIQNPNWTFLGEVEGDSMQGAGIANGDIVVVDKSLDARHGSIAICCIDGGLTIKKLHMHNSELYLLSANVKYKPIKVSNENDFSVWGVVTHTIKKMV
jgi:DNA polymerase V